MGKVSERASERDVQRAPALPCNQPAARCTAQHTSEPPKHRHHPTMLSARSSPGGPKSPATSMKRRTSELRCRESWYWARASRASMGSCRVVAVVGWWRGGGGRRVG